ncbi:hypothetical protein AB1J28_03775 [Lysinibacillus irui]|uniref:5-methylcytosine restriction system specificity protein McrC n=1 Tax=Lysinibacillus irui TaxID=2998077 RepID=UPI003D2A9AE7
MNKIQITENEKLHLDPESIEILKKSLTNFSDLPISIENNSLSFPDYTVGVIKLGDNIIEINSRNECMTMQRIFEMYAFVNSEKSLHGIIEGYDFSKSGIDDVLFTLYINICRSLVKEGLTGHFNKEVVFSKILYGEIDFTSYNPHFISLKGIPNQRVDYNLNTSSNRILKAALLKILKIEPRIQEQIIIRDILVNFENVETVHYTPTILEIDKREALSIFSTNRFYNLAINMAIEILMNIKATYRNGRLESKIFLVNSNDIFEKYIRKVLKQSLKNDVRKWEKPKEFAKITFEEVSLSKSYSPDILIDYNEFAFTARAIFDVKNKKFNPDIKNADIVNSSDIYQLLFYTQTLKSVVGCLIYPSNISSEPIKINISSPGNPSLFLIGVNMNLTFKERHIELIDLVTKKILICT